MTDSTNERIRFANGIDPELPVGQQEFTEVGEILKLLAKTISTIKIFLPEHTTVKRQIEELWKKLDRFLQEHQALGIGIQEHSFTYKEKPIFQDKKTIKSLPFLLFKDGMQMLSFHSGLKKEELQGFMEIIKSVYDLPPDESDIVNMLWEKDFASIRYLAPDEFLETKIGRGKKLAEIQVDRDALFSGSIELLPEDVAELQSAKGNPDGTEDAANENEELWEETEFVDQGSTLTEQENRILDAMLTANRQVTPEDELVLLITEMLNLEEDPERFKEILNAITHVHIDLVTRGDFDRAYHLICNILEIENIASHESSYKESLIGNFLQSLKTESLEEIIKKLLLEDKVMNFHLFFAYLDLLFGPEAIAFLGDLYEKLNNSHFQKGCLEYIREKAKLNPEILTGIIDDRRVHLTKEVIAILSSIPEKRAIQGFAVFIQSKNNEIKSAAIKSLGKFEDATSNKILLGFLNDRDENIRMLAAQHISATDGDFIAENVARITKNRNFKTKSKKEKQSLLDILGRIQTEKAYGTLEKLVTKLTFLSLANKTEAGICAIQTLEKIDSPESTRILKRGTQSKNRKIKEASVSALQNRSQPRDTEER